MAKFKHDHHTKSFSLFTKMKDGVCSRFAFDEWKKLSFCLSGDGDAAWKIAHVTLRVTDKFRYFFQGIRGSNSSTGAILIDDITLTETVCPIAVWQISNFTGHLATAAAGSSMKSQCFVNSEGYSFGISVYPNGRDPDYPDYVSMTMHLCSGENDAILEWPVKNRQVTIIAMDQDPDAKLRMSSARSFTTGTHRTLAFSQNHGQNLNLYIQAIFISETKGELFCLKRVTYPGLG